MEVRFAQAKDISAILGLLRQVGQVHHEARPDIFRSGAQKYGASQIIAMLDDPKTPIFVAQEGEKILGYGFCQVKIYDHDPVIADHTELYIDDLCVDEACRGQGVGATLYSQICRYAKMRKANRITLNVWCGNDNAMAFYERLGLKMQKIGLEMKLED